MRKLLGVFLVSVVLLVGCELDSGEQDVYLGEVQEKVFTSGQTSVNVGAGVPIGGENTGGTIIPMVGVGGTSDEYVLFVNDKKYKVSTEVWLKVEKGDKVLYTESFSGISEIGVIEREEGKYDMPESIVKQVTNRDDVNIVGKLTDNAYGVDIGGNLYKVNINETPEGFKIGNGKWEREIVK